MEDNNDQIVRVDRLSPAAFANHVLSMRRDASENSTLREALEEIEPRYGCGWIDTGVRCYWTRKRFRVTMRVKAVSGDGSKLTVLVQKSPVQDPFIVRHKEDILDAFFHGKESYHVPAGEDTNIYVNTGNIVIPS